MKTHFAQIGHHLTLRAPRGVRDEAQRQPGIAKSFDGRESAFNGFATHVNDAPEV
jgi:hypothetical protein